MKKTNEEIRMGQPEFGKQYALTGASGDLCISNGNTWAESEVKVVPSEVKGSEFGCRNCLWAGCECKNGMKYKAVTDGSKRACESYTYYD